MLGGSLLEVCQPGDNLLLSRGLFPNGCCFEDRKLIHEFIREAGRP